MFGNLFYALAMWLCAVVYIGFGIYSRNRRKPMWFWTGTKISADSVSDVRAYNHAMGKMWMQGSIPFWAAIHYQIMQKAIVRISCNSFFLFLIPFWLLRIMAVYALPRDAETDSAC